jgi:phospholipid transport system substrate-binding protein
VAPATPAFAPDAASAFIRLAGASLLLVVLFAASPARPEAPAGGATSVIEGMHATILSVMKEADELGFEGRYARLEPVLRATFDFDFMAEKAVGRHWRKLEPADQARMRDVFARFTMSTYASRFSGWSGERFEIHAEDPAPRDTVYVRTELVRSKGDDNVEINYRLHRTDAGWRVIDVLLRGTVSELALRRTEYSSVIKRDGFEALMSELEQKIADLTAGEIVEGEYGEDPA